MTVLSEKCEFDLLLMCIISAESALIFLIVIYFDNSQRAVTYNILFDCTQYNRTFYTVSNDFNCLISVPLA